MSRPVIWFRSFNAFLGQTVSVWSVGFLIAPWILSLIVAGFFAWPVLVPLAVVCGIVGAVALVWGGLIGYWRYLYLTKEADKFLNQFDLKPEDSVPAKVDIPPNTIILVKNFNNKRMEAYYKRYLAEEGEYVLISVDIDLTSEEEKIISPPETQLTTFPSKESEEDLTDTTGTNSDPSKESEGTSSTSSEEEPAKETLRYEYDLPLLVVKGKLPEEKTLKAPVLIRLENTDTGKFSFHIFGISERKTKFTDLSAINALNTLDFNAKPYFNAEPSIFISPEENKEIYQEIASKKGHTPRDPVINEIIDRVLSVGSIFNRSRTLDDANKLTQDQENIRTWERINAFLSDAPTAFIFSGIIIFLVSHVFFGALIPAALLIAVVVSLAYGVFSAFVKDAQVNSKFLTMKMLKDEYEAIRGKTNTFIDEAKAYIRRAEDLIKKNNEQGQEDLVPGIEKTKASLQQQISELESLQKNFSEIDNDEAEYTDKENFRVIYSLFYGGIVAGSFLYIALPLVVGALGFAPFSLPVLLGIVICSAVVYGAYHAWHKVKVIEQEKWATMDDPKIQEISASFAINRKALEESVQKIEGMEKEFAKSKEEQNLNLQDGSSRFNNVRLYLKEIDNAVQPIIQQVVEQYHDLGKIVDEKKDEVIKEVNKYSVIFSSKREYPEIELQNFSEDNKKEDKNKIDNSLLVEQQTMLVNQQSISTPS